MPSNGDLLSDFIPGARLTARPKLLTLELQEKICAHLREGQRRSTAAILAGISTQTMDNWMATGEHDPTSKCGGFYKAVLAAEKDHEAALVKRWTKINDTKDDYRGVEALLKHRHKWQAPAEQLEITGANGGAIQIGRADLEVLSVEELEQYQQLMSKMAQARLNPAQKQIDAPNVIDIEAEESDEGLQNPYEGFV